MRNLEGQTFGKLKVISRAEKPGRAAWICRCDCGATTKPVLENNLMRGLQNSCGCVKRRQWGNHTKHGDAKRGQKSVEWMIWREMNRRCSNPSEKDARYYRDLGIMVFPEWVESYEAFLSYMGRRPTPAHSIDRYPNLRGNYEPGNVRWATREEQGRNKRNNRLLTYKGETMTAVEWSERLNQPPTLLLNRLSLLHWTPEEAIQGYRNPR